MFYFCFLMNARARSLLGFGIAFGEISQTWMMDARNTSSIDSASWHVVGSFFPFAV